MRTHRDILSPGGVFHPHRFTHSLLSSKEASCQFRAPRKHGSPACVHKRRTPAGRAETCQKRQHGTAAGLRAKPSPRPLDRAVPFLLFKGDMGSRCCLLTPGGRARRECLVQRQDGCAMPFQSATKAKSTSSETGKEAALQLLAAHKGGRSTASG